MSEINIHKGRTHSPCHKCTEHSETCRSGCEKWKEYEEIHKKERAEINKRRKLYNLGYGAPYRTEGQLRNAHKAAREGRLKNGNII